MKDPNDRLSLAYFSYVNVFIYQVDPTIRILNGFSLHLLLAQMNKRTEFLSKSSHFVILNILLYNT